MNSGGKKTFSWNNVIWYAFYGKIATFTDFEKKSSVFFQKTPFFLKKKTNFVCFEKSYYFNRTVRQICYNLVIKHFHGQNRRTSDLITQWTFLIGKNVENIQFQRFEWMIFLPYYKYGRKIIIIVSLQMHYSVRCVRVLDWSRYSASFTIPYCQFWRYKAFPGWIG